jgi:predicted NAD/FAD-dependent oxidoreductase
MTAQQDQFKADSTPDTSSFASVIVIGAGLSGLMAARHLSASGVDVQILEKSRGVGGRCATRRIQEIPFDHGAQFFTVRDSCFQSIADDWIEKGDARVWTSGFPRSGHAKQSDGHPRYCAIHGMNSLSKALGRDLSIRTRTTVNAVERDRNGWVLRTETEEVFRAKTVILSAPLPQSLQLLDANACDELLRDKPQLRKVEYESCFAVLALLDGQSAVPEPGAIQVDGPVIAWIADNTQKFMGSGRSSLTIHTNPEFTRKHFDTPQDEIAETVLNAAREWLGSEVVEWQVQRWKYSKPVGFVGDPCVTWGDPTELVLCGDCMLPPSRMEGAVLSGLAAAETLLKDKKRLTLT